MGKLDEYEREVQEDIKGVGMHKNVHPSPSYACPRCSKLSFLLSEMASNPPGMKGVETSSGRLGNAHIDLGWTAAVNMLISRLEQR
jgi:hypothetical protein